ncbi:MAG: hypothetical protein AB2L22_14390 [Syntrophales bacterium]
MIDRGSVAPPLFWSAPWSSRLPGGLERQGHQLRTHPGSGASALEAGKPSDASLLLQQGESVKYIQSQLGHSIPSVTLNVYSHLMKTENQEAAQRLEKTIFSGDGSKMAAGKKKGVTA